MKVLDTFTTLEARRRQYQYYRDALLTFEEDTDAATRVRWITLDGIAINLDSQRRPLKKSVREAGEFAYYGASGIIDYVSDYIFDGDYLLVSEDGANLLARSTPIAFSISGKTWVNNHAHVLQFNSYIERRFVEIYLNSIDLSLYVSGAVQPKLNQANLNRIPIPIPPSKSKPASLRFSINSTHWSMTSRPVCLLRLRHAASSTRTTATGCSRSRRLYE
ncbi:restriction endonuclease subunit S [Xylella fastidiosa subsp. multiplex]|uniref:restriction endonuclease subunit S n=1 Tax=Xylella fastidiosa TaxID=2371 RepID=UPI0023684F12|nr:restriction endonuclease subunit S [Xylella fastidiosa]WDN64463.1 restriction endonuclease subunit S [Xylella fastidiosa subsp. multiplex]